MFTFARGVFHISIVPCRICISCVCEQTFGVLLARTIFPIFIVRSRNCCSFVCSLAEIKAKHRSGNIALATSLWQHRSGNIALATSLWQHRFGARATSIPHTMEMHWIPRLAAIHLTTASRSQSSKADTSTLLVLRKNTCSYALPCQHTTSYFVPNT